jgi:endoglucanase Acf2
VTTDLKDTTSGNLNRTLQSLFRHQWLNLETTSKPLLKPYTYGSIRVEMKVLDGNVFTTTLLFNGVLDVLPNKAAGDPAYESQLRSYLQAADKTLPDPDSYFSGKEMARLAKLIRIADHSNNDDLVSGFLTPTQTTLQDWLTFSGDSDRKFFYYDDQWDTLIAYDPGSFGSDTLLNDHHFHYGYFIMAAAALAKQDPGWESPSHWGGRVELLIKDVANWDRSDARFPFLRYFDPYAGHNWAGGPAKDYDGNNQESSSEAMNFANALIHWGKITGNDDIHEMGIYLYATQASAIHEYWFDATDSVFPNTPSTKGRSFDWPAVGMVWGGKGDAESYFGAAAACVIGINILPMTGGSLYLGKYPQNVKKVYDYAESAYDNFKCWTPPPGPSTPSPPPNADDWAPLFWEYYSFKDPVAADGMFNDTSLWLNAPSSGISPAQVYYWLKNMKALGTLHLSVTANNPFSVVYTKPTTISPRLTGCGSWGCSSPQPALEYTYVSHNHTDEEILVTFSDGFQLAVPPRVTIYAIETVPIFIQSFPLVFKN